MLSSGVTFSGVVRGPGGAPLPHARLQLGEGEAEEAGADGSFSFTVEPGTYSLAVWGSREGVSPTEAPSYYEFAGAQVKLYGNLTQDLTLPLHTLTVRVKGPGGTPVAGVKFEGPLVTALLPKVIARWRPE